jgi:hypothetical protein
MGKGALQTHSTGLRVAPKGYPLIETGNNQVHLSSNIWFKETMQALGRLR